MHLAGAGGAHHFDDLSARGAADDGIVDQDDAFADVAKIERLLHWRAKTSLEDGVARMLERIDDWRDAPVWEPASIAVATTSWFAHLGGNRS